MRMGGGRTGPQEAPGEGDLAQALVPRVQLLPGGLLQLGHAVLVVEELHAGVLQGLRVHRHRLGDVGHGPVWEALQGGHQGA